MMKLFSPVIIILLYSIVCSVVAQSNTEEIKNELIERNLKTNELQGLVLDKNNINPLPFTSIVFLNKNEGTISNEDGYFTINSELLNSDDTISVQFMGYKSITITLADFRNNPIVYLEENIFSLSTIFVFGSQPDAKDIIEKVIEKKDDNYININAKSKIFIRQRNTNNLENFTLKFKKNTFKSLNNKIIKLIEKKIPKYTSSFNDFLGYLLQKVDDDNTVRTKIKPIQAVVLKGKEVDYSNLESVFKKLFKNTKETEYWKIKSGILSTKIEINDDDSVKLEDDEVNMRSYKYDITDSYKFSSFNDKQKWEFLYKTGRYKYTIAGGTVVNGEEVYIIDFEPDGGGMYKGRLFVSIATSALVKADYEYAPGKHSTNIHIFGVAYRDNKFKASIYFEKIQNSYRLKYISLKSGIMLGINRVLSLIKKKERFFFDKKLHEYKVRLKMKQNTEHYTEILVIDEKKITNKDFNSYKPKDKMKVIYVKRFDDNLWSNFTIIPPTKQMKDYRDIE